MATELPLVFDNLLLHSLWMQRNIFQDFNVTNLRILKKNICNFFMFLKKFKNMNKLQIFFKKILKFVTFTFHL